MPRNIKLTIEYDGTHFSGWQIQRSGSRTVQGEISKTLKIIFKEKLRLTGSGRTDAGVHALGQVANFQTSSLMSTSEMRNALNANLPVDITILNVEEVAADFHAQYSAKFKTYRYVLLHRPVRPAQGRQYCLFILKDSPRRPALNMLRMREEAKTLVGRQDFKSFQSANKDNTLDTIRTVKRMDIKKKGDYIFIEIEANGFLYKMVRNIIGTLLAIGSGKMPQGSMKKILSQKDRQYAAATAKAQGLTLVEVVY